MALIYVQAAGSSRFAHSINKTQWIEVNNVWLSLSLFLFLFLWNVDSLSHFLLCSANTQLSPTSHLHSRLEVCLCVCVWEFFLAAQLDKHYQWHVYMFTCFVSAIFSNLQPPVRPNLTAQLQGASYKSDATVPSITECIVNCAKLACPLSRSRSLSLWSRRSPIGKLTTQLTETSPHCTASELRLQPGRTRRAWRSFGKESTAKQTLQAKHEAAKWGGKQAVMKESGKKGEKGEKGEKYRFHALRFDCCGSLVWFVCCCFHLPLVSVFMGGFEWRWAAPPRWMATVFGCSVHRQISWVVYIAL